MFLMGDKERKKLTLYPAKIALIFIIPSLALYLFFSIWPIAFSVYIAFTDATYTNLSPDPGYLKELHQVKTCLANVYQNKSLIETQSMNAYNNLRNAYEKLYYSYTGLGKYLVQNATPDMFFLNDVKTNVSDASDLIVISINILRKLIPCETKRVTLLDPGLTENLSKVQGLLADANSVLESISFAIFGGEISMSDLERVYQDIGEAVEYMNYTISYVREIALNFDEYIISVEKHIDSEIDKLQLHFVGLKNIYDLFHDSRFIYSIYKTLLFVATSVPLKVLIGVLLAFFFSSPMIWGRKAWRAILLIPWALPILLSGVTWRIMFTPGKGPLALLFTNLFNRPFSIYAGEWDAFIVYNLFEAWLAYPFIMTVTMGAIAGIPKEIIEASYIDGASIWLRFRKILLPQVRGPVLFATVLTTGASLQAFMVPLLINGGGPVGNIVVLGLEPRTGRLNEMMVLFGYNRARIDQLYGYAAAVYLVLTIFLAIYIFAWLRITKMGGRHG